jgi:hypothetical protein
MLERPHARMDPRLHGPAAPGRVTTPAIGGGRSAGADQWAAGISPDDAATAARITYREVERTLMSETHVMEKASIVDRVRARSPTYWRYLREDPWWILMFLFARILAARRVERWMARASHRRPGPAPNSLLGAIDLDRAVRDLITDGVHVGLKLPAAIVAELRDFADATPCFARDRQDRGFPHREVAAINRERDRDIVAGYYFEAVEHCAAIRRLREDPALLAIAEAYIGHAPVLIRIRLWWSFPAARVSDADLHAVAQEKFHFDMNGWRTLKFFFYLTATSQESGAHRCIVGSHRRRPLKQQFTLTVGRDIEELRDFYGQDRFLTITGEAGTGFAEDPFVFHTGSLCRDQPRLILELEFGPRTVNPSYRYGRLG